MRSVRDRADQPVTIIEDTDEYLLAALPTGKPRPVSAACGFCGPHVKPESHLLCPGSIRNGSQCPTPIWVCACYREFPEAHPNAILLT